MRVMEGVIQHMNDLTKNENQVVPANLYKNANVGTESVTPEDLNTPVIKIMQPTTQGIDDMQIGAFYRTDTKQQYKELDVNFVAVSSLTVENFNKTGMENVKVYYGFYAGTNEPFKMYLRGWGLGTHRQFQTEVLGFKNKYNIPMLALTVTLKTEKQQGTLEGGKPYTIYKPVFDIVKFEDGTPVVEIDPKRVDFLLEAADRFSNLPQSENDYEQNDVTGTPNEVKNEDIPF